MGEMNPYDVARRANNRITPQGVSKIVKGESDLKVDTLVLLATALNTTAPELLLRALEPHEGATPDAKAQVEHKQIIEDYDDIPPQCQKDVRDLLRVLRQNHSVSQRRERQQERKADVAARAAEGSDNVRQLSTAAGRQRDAEKAAPPIDPQIEHYRDDHQQQRRNKRKQGSP